MKSVNIVIKIEGNCTKCPYCQQRRTIGAGYALDYFCSKVKSDMGSGRLIMGYIEYPSEMEPIPDWCPFMEGK